jgi:hypothetical protein
MKILFVFSIFLLVASQTKAQEVKKIKKLLGYDVVKLEPTQTYDWAPKGDVIFYPSQTLKGDTTGASNDGEFLMFRDEIVSRKGESFKLFRLNWVTNREYETFVKWVRDSIMMEHIYANTDPSGSNSIPDEIIGEMLNHPDVYFDSINNLQTEFDPSQPFINRELFPFSWRMKGIYDQQIIPLISDLYLSPSQRFNRNKDWDERKLSYAFDKSHTKEILISPDRDVWAQQSKYPFDFYYNLANYYSREAPNQYMPVIGLLGTQIQAFLHYKERIIQKQLDEKGYNYFVHLSLPTEEEIKLADTSDCDCKMTYLLEPKDMTDQWAINNKDYWEFMSWVQDSILRENIYLNSKSAIENEVIGEMLDYEDVYFDVVNLAWTEFDPGQPYINRGLFTLDYKFNWKKELLPNQYIPLIENYFQHPKESLSENGEVDHKDFKLDKYSYRYYWQDLGRRAQKGELEWDEKDQEFELKDNWVGRDFDTDYRKAVQNKSGIRRHESLGRFIIQEELNIYPGVNCQACNEICAHEHGDDLRYEEYLKVCKKCPEDWNKRIRPYDFWSEPEALVQDLSYAQALAFYNWKYHRHTWWEKSDTRFHDDLVPTEDQFIQIQKGESITIEEQKLEYPDPWFRYVIHFYPKD